MPMQPAIVTVGTLPIDDRLRSLARSFGWWLFRVAEAHQVQAAGNAVDVVAILFEPREVASSWQEALKIVRSAAPRALPVVCHRFSDWLPWHELAAAGAFHELWPRFLYERCVRVGDSFRKRGFEKLPDRCSCHVRRSRTPL